MVPAATACTGVLRGDRMSTASWPRLPPSRRCSNSPFHDATLAPSIGTRRSECEIVPVVRVTLGLTLETTAALSVAGVSFVSFAARTDAGIGGPYDRSHASAATPPKNATTIAINGHIRARRVR